MDLPIISFFYVAFALTLYVILDGFDLGVGMLLLFQPATTSRDHMVDSITPTWDGNETWIIMAGVTLLAAFPVAYSILLPAFYLPLILMLLALGIRGVSFEFRVQSKQHRREWDVAFTVGSFVAAFMQGLVLGGLMQGVRVQDLQFSGSVLDVVHPLPIITGFALPFGYAMLGGGWLKLKSNLPLQDFAKRSIRVSAALFAILLALACLCAVKMQPCIRSRWISHGILLACLAALFAIASAFLTTLNKKTRPEVPFLLGLILFLLAISGLALTTFPDIVPFSVTLREAASSWTSQMFVLIGAAFVTPIILTYSAFAYWIFRGKTPDKGWGV